MKKIIFASIEENVGKTSIILSLARTMGKKCAYLKPFGDRMRYRKKKLWDYDSELINKTLELGLEPEHMTLGFEHAKLRYKYDEKSLQEKINQMCLTFEKNNDVLFLEGANTLSYGASVGMNSLRIAKITDSQLIIVLTGNTDKVQDDLTFIRHNIVESGVNFAGVIINKINDIDEFQCESVTQYIKDLGIKVYGLLPNEKKLSTMSMRQIGDALTATTITAPNHLDNNIENIYIGSMSLNEVFKKEYLQKDNKLMITSGDRSDIILAAIESKSKGIVLTNNILPPPNIISRAGECNIPILLAGEDTYSVANKIDKLDALMGVDDNEKFELMDDLVKKHVNIGELL
ncbi:MAG: AAA family ATPase [Bacteriovoracaceae bacterium]|nr:AAA family ATPase [Bacteriovoracaceae bacterium]